jgi:hypothetical protein
MPRIVPPERAYWRSVNIVPMRIPNDSPHIDISTIESRLTINDDILQYVNTKGHETSKNIHGKISLQGKSATILATK